MMSIGISNYGLGALVCVGLLLLGLCTAQAGETYYLSAEGSDTATGRSKNAAWKTLERASQHIFSGGDTLVLRGGDTFSGNLSLNKKGGNGTFKVTSQGKGRAVILATTGKAAVMLYNIDNVAVSNLEVRQEGDDPQLSGVMAYCDDATVKRFPNLLFEDLEISGFGMFGLGIGADQRSLCGFDNVTIRRVRAHHNRAAGIISWGYAGTDLDGFSHRNITVQDCVAHDNYGIPDKIDNHSGSGIVIGGVAGALIERCEAYANGKHCNCPKAGPVGIWAWDATKVIIRHCVSHNNRTGAKHDGGGFDLDGGVTDSIMEYNISYDNAGAGYLVCQYDGSRRPLSGCIVRNNYSRNDGRVSSFAGIYVTGFDKAHAVKDILIENNVIETRTSDPISPVGIGVTTYGGQPCGVVIRNNLILCGSDAQPVVVGKNSAKLVKVENNIGHNIPDTAK